MEKIKIQDISSWEAYYWVAKEGGFTKAARRMKVGIPLLSKKVAQLEESLGAKLFHRSTRVVSLTDEGKSLLPRISAVLEDLASLETELEAGSEISGTIRMTTLPGLAHRYLAPMLSEFKAKHPKVSFEIDLSDKVIDLVEEGFDIAVRAQRSSDSSLVVRKLAVMKLVFCCSPKYQKRVKTLPKKPQDLRCHPLLMLEAHKKCAFEGTEMKLKEFAKNLDIRCESGMFLTELALQGNGIAIRADWDVRPFIKSGELIEVLKNHPLETYGEILAVIPTRKLLSPRVRVFLDFLVERSKAWF